MNIPKIRIDEKNIRRLKWFGLLPSDRWVLTLGSTEWEIIDTSQGFLKMISCYVEDGPEYSYDISWGCKDGVEVWHSCDNGLEQGYYQYYSWQQIDNDPNNLNAKIAAAFIRWRLDLILEQAKNDTRWREFWMHLYRKFTF